MCILFDCGKIKSLIFKSLKDDVETGQIDIPPFYFPIKGDSPKEITETMV
jgi:hypothetical protein